MKDDIKAAWGEIKEYIKMQLNCVITSWLVVTYDKIMTLKKIITTYLDVTNDCILLGAVVATIDFILFDQVVSSFQFQVAVWNEKRETNFSSKSQSVCSHSKPYLIMLWLEEEIFLNVIEEASVIWVEHSGAVHEVFKRNWELLGTRCGIVCFTLREYFFSDFETNEKACKTCAGLPAYSDTG